MPISLIIVVMFYFTWFNIYSSTFGVFVLLRANVFTILSRRSHVYTKVYISRQAARLVSESPSPPIVFIPTTSPSNRLQWLIHSHRQHSCLYYRDKWTARVYTRQDLARVLSQATTRRAPKPSGVYRLPLRSFESSFANIGDLLTRNCRSSEMRDFI
jgi:hypothetical protein